MAPSVRQQQQQRQEGAAVVAFGEALLCFKPGPGADGASIPCRRDVGGSELNVACAAASLGRTALFLSVLPEGPLGDTILGAARQAGVDVSQVTRDSSADAEVGTLHTHAGTVIYQRRNSSFCKRVDAEQFDWARALKSAGVLVASGINPALGFHAGRAWQAALNRAKLAEVPVAFDLNWRPQLTDLPALWQDVRQHLVNSRAATLIVVARSNLAALSAIEHTEPPRDDSAEAALQCLRLLREKLQVPLLACCFKESLPDRPGWQSRWSAVAAEGVPPVVTTRRIPTQHCPREPLGGGDAWLGGFLDAAVDSDWFPQRYRGGGSFPTPDELEAALRSGDLLAALSQERQGDLCLVPRSELSQLEKAFAGRPAIIGTAADSELRREVEQLLRACPVVPVITVESVEDAAPLCRALIQGGLRCIEVTLRTRHAEAALRAMVKEAGGDAVIGAGTVLSPAQVRGAARAGARFLVSPGLDPDVVAAARDRGLPLYPGVATATDIAAALRHGLSDLKFFPAEALGGTGLLRALSAPHRGVRFMPTGGINKDNLAGYLKLPFVLACGGSWMVPAKLLQRKDWGEIQRLAADAAQRAAAARSPPQPAARM
eukprot:TRINITY_DN13758_c1_g1_i1.p1 TRINITY_DN13758_c1_g1~~TRINITY_DN13758_c1_g1_i1.p1  ORF type:complete len:611 (+),score=137.36 TRINITY_DN13758_c1_g1_i1:26-1834(+)